MVLAASDFRPSTDVLPPTSAGAPRLKLVVLTGEDTGRELFLDRGTYKVGTDPGCDLVLRDSAVSRTHLLVAVTDGGVKITDNRSTNGSYCEGMRFEALEVKAGATLRIGRAVVLKVVPAAGPARGPAPVLSPRTRFGELTGEGPTMRELFGLLERVAASGSDVLIQGETGTGKELCARALHSHSARQAQAFVVCDLGAVSQGLIESELFGHAKGAFTGAVGDRAGPFERADGGTVFLDEVGELPLELQTRLLRVVEQREVRRVGETDYRKVDVRIFAATHHDLERKVKEGTFRQDLYYRLAVATVTLPPLRERPEDLPVLIDEILGQLGKAHTDIDPQTRAMLSDYSWPGNVRELRNVVERAVMLGADRALDPGDALRARTSSAPGVASGLPFKEAKERMVEAFERDYLAQVLRRCDGNLSKASREAGIARFYLRQLVKKHKLDGR